MWSIGNEIPDSTSPEGVADGRAADRRRPRDRHDAADRDGLGQVPQRARARARRRTRSSRMLDGLGLNYNTARSVDALHARTRTSSSSSRSPPRRPRPAATTRTPISSTRARTSRPAGASASSYDNNLESWTMSGEYSLKKDRDRPYFAGEFLWSGMDYIGEPTPYYDVFPVKTSFFGAVDTAGFPKDQYYLFRSQWTSRPMVHLLPMDWTRHEPGETVQVRAYANVDEVELFLTAARWACGGSIASGRRRARSTSRRPSRRVTTRPRAGPPGSYTSPNGSAGHLYLTLGRAVRARPARGGGAPRRPGGRARRGPHRRAPVRAAAAARPARSSGRSGTSRRGWSTATASCCPARTT